MESVLQLEEILETIFQFLRPSDLKSAASVCRFWSETAKNDSLWRVLCEKFMYPVSEHESALDVFRESFVSWSPEPGRSTTHKMQSHSQGVRGVDFIERTDPAESVFVAAADDGCVSLWYVLHRDERVCELLQEFCDIRTSCIHADGIQGRY